MMPGQKRHCGSLRQTALLEMFQRLKMPARKEIIGDGAESVSDITAQTPTRNAAGADATARSYRGIRFRRTTIAGSRNDGGSLSVSARSWFDHKHPLSCQCFEI
jgi:hypothetical protein